MPYERISVTPLSPVIGAEVSGVDLSQPLGNLLFQEIHDALIEHQVIFFRDQEMTLEQHKAFGRLFGALHVHPAAPATDGDEEVVTIHADENSTSVSGGQMWHTDVSADDEPPMGSILHLQQVPEPGGDTLFASMYAAYEALSDEMKTFLGGAKAWHSSEKRRKARYGHLGQLRDIMPSKALHPIVRTHPVSGRKPLRQCSFSPISKGSMSKRRNPCAMPHRHARVRLPVSVARQFVAFWDNRCARHRPAGTMRFTVTASRSAENDLNRRTCWAMKIRRGPP